ncbi:lateral signaling target protein 2-like [Dysidea avara]|uniref:lateral signaling target protein 2-like n=1 Tax=Dysidea avara TaxID=196820 RepID=UPI00332D5406
MQGLKRYFDKPKFADKRPLSLFYYCDREVTRHMVHMNQLLRSNPDDLNRRNEMIQQLKQSQHNLMNVILNIIEDAIPDSRSPRHFRAKYPDDVLLDQINGPIWFGAECIAAGSHIAHHEWESNELRPYAVHLTECVQKVREALREQCKKDCNTYPEKLRDLLRWFDFTWAEFEFRYVSLMCTVKSELQYAHQQALTVLFSEATQRAIEKGYLSKDMVDYMDPSLMFAIPRLAIVCGVAVHEDGPLCTTKPVREIPMMFRVYRSVLCRIKELLGHLTNEQFQRLERALCSAEGLGTLDRKKKDSKKKSANKKVETSSVSTSSQVGASGSAPLDLPASHDPECVFEPRPHGAEEQSIVMEQNTSDVKEVKQSTLDSTKDDMCAATSDKGPLPTEIPSGEDLESQKSQPADEKPKTKGPAGFSSAEDLMHRLFVAISGVADQLQTNHARDFRVILKHVFLISQSEPEDCDFSHNPMSPCTPQPTSPLDLQSQSFTFSTSSVSSGTFTESSRGTTVQRPAWVPDNSTKNCQSCTSAFTMTRRRHHCRSCGQVVCSNCSPNTIPLSKLGYKRSVRVCTKCYIDQLSQRANSDGYRPVIL